MYFQIAIDAIVDFIRMEALNFKTFDYLNSIYFFHHFRDKISFSNVTQSFVLFQVRSDKFEPQKEQHHYCNYNKRQHFIDEK